MLNTEVDLYLKLKQSPWLWLFLNFIWKEMVNLVFLNVRHLFSWILLNS